jgi:hypothetical protein
MERSAAGGWDARKPRSSGGSGGGWGIRGGDWQNRAPAVTVDAYSTDLKSSRDLKLLMHPMF